MTKHKLCATISVRFDMLTPLIDVSFTLLNNWPYCFGTRNSPCYGAMAIGFTLYFDTNFMYFWEYKEKGKIKQKFHAILISCYCGYQIFTMSNKNGRCKVQFGSWSTKVFEFNLQESASFRIWSYVLPVTLKNVKISSEPNYIINYEIGNILGFQDLNLTQIMTYYAQKKPCNFLMKVCLSCLEKKRQ